MSARNRLEAKRGRRALRLLRKERTLLTLVVGFRSVVKEPFKDWPAWRITLVNGRNPR